MASGKQSTDMEEVVGNCIKYLVFFFNLIFWIIGGLLIGLGAWAYIEKDKYYHNDAESIYDILFDVSILMIIVGVVIFIFAFLGCTGALRENLVLLRIFSVVLLLVIVLELVGAILVFLFSEQIKTEVQDIIKEEGIARYRDDADFQSLVDWFQETFECCGVGLNGYKQWSLNPYFNCSEANPSVERCGVPFSCCRVQNNIETDVINTACGYDTQLYDTVTANKVIFTGGCIDEILKDAESQMFIVGGVAIGCVLLQMLNLFLSLQMVKKIDAYETFNKRSERFREGILEGYVNHGNEHIDVNQNPGVAVINLNSPNDHNGRVPDRARNGSRHPHGTLENSGISRSTKYNNKTIAAKQKDSSLKDKLPTAVRVGLKSVPERTPRYQKNTQQNRFKK